jgi:hypothetical protein
MNRRVFSASVAAAVALLASLVVPAQGSATVTVSRFPVSFSLFNPCTNENVKFNGIGLGLIETTPDDNHFIFHAVDIRMHGIGQTSGAGYVETFAITIALQGDDASGPFAETNAVHSRLIAPGPRNDLTFSIVFHFTLNAAGEIVVFHNTVTNELCV